jgi:hypothetical protein
MRSRILLTAVALVAATASPANAQQMFEGSITYEMAGAGQNMTLTSYAKGTRFRTDMTMQGGGASILSEAGSNVLTIVLSQQRMFVKMDPTNMNPMIAGMMRGMGPSQPQPNTATLRATGQTETIAGKSCDHYAGKDGTETLDICVAKGMGYFSFISMGGMTPPPSAAQTQAIQSMFGDGFVPLKMTSTTGGQTITITATAISTGALGDDFFQPPAGFMEIRIP